MVKAEGVEAVGMTNAIGIEAGGVETGGIEAGGVEAIGIEAAVEGVGR